MTNNAIEALMDALISRKSVVEMLTNLLEQAEEVEAKAGEMPTAREALEWALSEVDAMPDADAPGG